MEKVKTFGALQPLRRFHSSITENLKAFTSVVFWLLEHRIANPAQQQLTPSLWLQAAAPNTRGARRQEQPSPQLAITAM